MVRGCVEDIQPKWFHLVVAISKAVATARTDIVRLKSPTRSDANKRPYIIHFSVVVPAMAMVMSMCRFMPG